jgi:hypothetical protein
MPVGYSSGREQCDTSGARQRSHINNYTIVVTG